MTDKTNRWTDEELFILKKYYSDTPAKDIAKMLGKKTFSIHHKASDLGLKKSKEFLKKQGQKLSALGLGNRYSKGYIPFNKGKKQVEYSSPESILKMQKAQFKKGSKPHNAQCDGHERIDKYGYVWIKVSGKRHQPKQKVVWEKINGKIPAKHIIIFKDKNIKNFAIDNLECISMQENMRRNTLHQYPEELQKLIKTKNKLNKKINEYA